MQGTAAGTGSAQERIHLPLLGWGAAPPATAHRGKPSVSCEQGPPAKAAHPGWMLLGWGRTRIIPWALDPAGLQCSLGGQDLTGKSGAGDSCWGNFQSRFSVQMLSV